jgi:hypothetical protein
LKDFLSSHPAQLEGDYDAAEIDREIIASRLQKDVVSSQLRLASPCITSPP